MNYNSSLEFARKQDAEDPLASYRDRFHIPRHHGRDCIYFTGNSLGLQPRSVRAAIDQELTDWAELGVEGHFKGKNPWFSYHEQFAGPLSRIVGAQPEEVVAMNGLTTNVHVLLTSFYRPTKERYHIIVEAKAFPSDQYAVESQVSLHGLDPKKAIIEIAPKAGAATIEEKDILNTIEAYKDTLALVFIGGVNYYSGQVFDMEKITAAAHEAGAYAGFDLAHAAGNIRLRLHDWNVDFACWCSYKYLNSSPGGISGVFIHQRHATNRQLPRMAGWWGYDKETRFLMNPGFNPIPTAEGWQLSNAPVLLMAAHKAALEVFDAAGMEALISKSDRLTGYLFFLLDEINSQYPEPVIQVITPREEGRHGCQVSMLMKERGRELFEQLTAAGVIADWREPNVIRIAPVPLYNKFEDIWHFANLLKTMLQQ